MSGFSTADGGAGRWRITGSRFPYAYLRTTDAHPLTTVVSVSTKNTKEHGCLLTSLPGASGKELVKHYARRFTGETCPKSVRLEGALTRRAKVPA